MASLGSYLPPRGSAVWRRDRATDQLEAEGNRVRHVVIRGAEVRDQPNSHVVYKIDVLTDHNHWYLYRRYSHFRTLHVKMVKCYGVSPSLLPPKKFSGNLSKQLIDTRRLALERYLQHLIHSEVRVSQAPELLEFLDVPANDIVKVTDALSKHLCSFGEELLEEATPIALTVNEMYCITQRLKLPRDALGSDPGADLGHLYSFVYQVQHLRVTLPPPSLSITCSPFELSAFKSLECLKLDAVPINQVSGIVSLQQNLRRLCVYRMLRSLREVLVDTVEERRAPPPSPPSHHELVESWRIVATAKLTDSRVVVQPWYKLHTLSLPHNNITHLDESLQLLPALKELDLSHNALQCLDVSYLCIPSLERVLLAHNGISQILGDGMVLEGLKELDLAHNCLHSLESVHCFLGVRSLDLRYNLLASKQDIDRLVQLRRLAAVHIAGNPISLDGNARLLLLAKFILHSKTVSVDGHIATNKEQVKVRGLVDRYGDDPDLWPLATSLTPPKMPQATAAVAGTEPPAESPVLVSWAIRSSRDRGGPFPYTRSFSILSQDSLLEHQLGVAVGGVACSSRAAPGRREGGAVEEEKYCVGGVAVGGVARDEPDGHSDTSSSPLPEPSTPPSHTLTPPPSTPLVGGEGVGKPQISPGMIQSALLALSQLQNRATPLSHAPREEGGGGVEPVFPEAIASALTAWIRNEQGPGGGASPLLSPPPSTPSEGQGEQPCSSISAADLFNALAMLLPPGLGAGEGESAGEKKGSGSGESSGEPPSCASREGLSQWKRLGIKPEEIIQALSVLTVQHCEEPDRTPSEEEGN